MMSENNTELVYVENPFLMNWKHFFNKEEDNDYSYGRPKRKSKKINHNDIQGEAPLDTYIKFVRGQSQKYRLEMEKMKRFSGRVLVDEKDKERGYNTTCMCGVKRLGDYMGLPVQVCKSKENGTMYFSGLAKCGSVWRCPVCSFRLTEQRGKEVYKMASEWFRQEGCYISFMTLTMAHKSTDKLTDLSDTLVDEFRKFQRTKVFKRLKEEHGIYGFVRTFEQTYGKSNGWHPHLHLMVFHKSDPVKVEKMHEEFLEAWVKRKKIKARLSAQNAQIVSEVRLLSGICNEMGYDKGNDKVKL